MRIYVASSWRNRHQPKVVNTLVREGHQVYDFRNPPNRSGFGWEQISERWKEWTPEEFRESLNHPLAVAGYAADMQGVRQADLGVLVLPSGRSASFEAGVMFGMGKPVIVYQPEPCESELMYRECQIVTDLAELVLGVRIIANHRQVEQGEPT
jgi:hypothetical protein